MAKAVHKETRSKAAATRKRQKRTTRQGRRSTMSASTKKLVAKEARRKKQEADQKIKIKITRESIHKDSKVRKKKRRKFRSVDYKRVGLDHPTSSPAISNMSENDRIKCAMRDIATGKFRFVSKAAAYWRVHAAKLYRRHSGEVPLEARRGPKKVLTEQDEEALINWVVTMGKRGFPVAPGMVCDAVKLSFRKEGNPFTNDRPSHTWYHKFVRRHPKLQQGLKMSQLTAICRADLTKAMIDEWFRELQRFLSELGVLDKPKQIWSYGQTGFEMNKKTERIIMTFFRKTGKGMASDDYDDYDQRREVNINVCANASGELLPPFIVCKGFPNAPKENNFLEGAPLGSGKRLLEGYSGSEDNFGYWIKNHLVPLLDDERPVVLLVDMEESEISYGAFAAATEHDIHLFRVPQQAAALLHPLEIGEEGAFKSRWLTKWVKRNRHVPVNFKNVGGLIGEAWIAAENPEAIRTCFIQSGVYPPDREMVDDEHLPTGNFEFLDAINQSDDEKDLYDDADDDSDADGADAVHSGSSTPNPVEECIPENKQPIAALLLFQKLDDTLDKPMREMYRTCVESGVDLGEEAPMFYIWKKLYTEAFKNDPNVPLTSVEEVIVTTTTPEKSVRPNAKEAGLVAGVGTTCGEETVCPVCKEHFGEDEEEWIGCDGDCQLWFHVNCLPPELVTPAMLEDKEMFCPQCSKSRKDQED